MRKRIIAISVIASLVISMSGCNKAEAPEVSSVTTASAQQISEEKTTAETAVNKTDESVLTTTTQTSAKTIETTTSTEQITAVETEEITTTSAVTTVNVTEATTAADTTAVTEATTVETTGLTTADAAGKQELSDEKTVYEAEEARFADTLKTFESDSFSGGAGVENFGNNGDYICFDIDVPSDGMYDITFVSSGIGSYKENNVIIDGTSVGVFKSDQEKLTESVIPSINLSKGKHEIKITPSWGWIRLDCIQVAAAEGISDELYDVGDTLINKKSNEATKNLFRYLSESYGKYVLSGQVCDDGYNGREFTAIYNETGKRPAILGLDMMDYTPSRTALGAKSHAVETAVEFADMGGIVTFCWHWNAPTEYLKSGKDSENGNPRWWGGFYTRNSTFDIAKVMNGDDPEGKAAIDRDIEEIAKQLKRLDNAGVPVLWRPLHEASGGWFWWGAKGADVYKELWIYLYEELTYKYECNNLIWVFNAQNADWYPGDEYVDIIGEDIYPGNHVYAPQTAKFKEATAYSGSNKIVALTENGCIFDIDQAVATNTMWAWFCTWGGEFAVSGSSYSEKYTEKEILKKVYDSEYVISFDELPDIY